LRPNTFTRGPLPTFVGQVDGLEDLLLPGPWRAWDCRNNRLAWLALQQDGFAQAAQTAIKRWGATRVAVLMGTSTSSIGASEEAYTRLTPEGAFPSDLARPEVHALHSLGGFVATALGAQGPCVTVATACSSSAKVMAQAERLIRSGLVDAAVVGGVDSLCQSVLYGFHALGLVSADVCRPFDAARRGINLAEAGAFALLERPSLAGPAGLVADALCLIGHGESSDAHHMSAPHPQGLGARLAMQQALARAGLPASGVNYINLHGTATPLNDAVEAAAVASMFPPETRVSSTKACTGHTLGAAGMLEAVICLMALQQGWMPGSLHAEQPDPTMGEAFAKRLLRQSVSQPLRTALSNSFGFGGNNCALLFGRVAAAELAAGDTAGFGEPAQSPEAASFAAVDAPVLTLRVLGAGLWAEGLGTWADASSLWRGERSPLHIGGNSDSGAKAAASAKPQATLLPAAERRRAPATVSLALDVADQACRMAFPPANDLAPGMTGQAPAPSGPAPSAAGPVSTQPVAQPANTAKPRQPVQGLRSVFCSSLGDMAITDYLCRTLAESPEHLSPTKFHHSVHNAAAGYWTMAVGNMQASSAMAGGATSFAQALLEAAAQAECTQQPVLLVAYDMASPWPLAPITGSSAMLGLALVLAPVSAEIANALAPTTAPDAAERKSPASGDSAYVADTAASSGPGQSPLDAILQLRLLPLEATHVSHPDLACAPQRQAVSGCESAPAPERAPGLSPAATASNSVAQADANAEFEAGTDAATQAAAQHPATAALLGRNPMAPALPLFMQLALIQAGQPEHKTGQPLHFKLSSHLQMEVQVASSA
jgi:3-oxoacyl-[acyl-carrier-protein] synthase-1